MSRIADLRLLACSAAVAALIGPVADAQPAAPQATGGSDVLAEVVVTATRQADTVNKVPLSITAVTEATLDKQGVKTAADLARTVPGLVYHENGGDRLANIAIRGIATQAGASTTGVYFDDVPLQETGISGGPVTGAGTPLPQIFDLDRIEVLKGPQGTLYGGSSEGGTVRFITPTPSLTHYSGFGQAEGSSTENGSPSYNVGAAIGGPIVQDKLGFRASVYDKHVGGYIDDISRFDGHTVAKDTNYWDSDAYRLVLLWKPIEQLEITPSVYLSHTQVHDADTFWKNIPQYTIAATAWQANGKTAATSPANTAFTLPAHTYGPYNMLGPYRSGNVTNIGDNYAGQVAMRPLFSPSTQELRIFSNSMQYDFGSFTGKLITSWVSNQNKGASDASYSDTRILTNSPYLFDLPLYSNILNYNDHHNENVQELRFVSKPGDSRLSWVTGVYNSFSRQATQTWVIWNYGDLTQAARGVSDTVFYGAGPVYTATNPQIDPVARLGEGSFRNQELIEKESAVYGEGNYLITDKLKFTAGLRYSRTEIDYKATYFGQTLGSLIPTTDNGGLTNGSKVETPLSPKAGLSYQFTPDTMVYANAAKGYRIGGINSPAAQSKCASDLAAIGLTQLPVTFNSDSVWSYELGAKTRLTPKMQVNSSVFYIDWQNPQTRVSLPTCGTNYVVNAGHAVSQGVDASVQARVLDGLTISGQLAYTDSHYTTSVGLDTPTAHPRFVLAGDRLPVPAWSGALSAEYDFAAPAGLPAFVRADYQFTGAYQQGPGPGTTSYAPDSYILPEVRVASMRAGVTIRSVQLSLYSNNVFGSRDITSLGGGRASCPDAACTAPRANNPSFTGVTLRPREVGVTANYRF